MLHVVEWMVGCQWWSDPNRDEEETQLQIV